MHVFAEPQIFLGFCPLNFRKYLKRKIFQRYGIRRRKIVNSCPVFQSPPHKHTGNPKREVFTLARTITIKIKITQKLLFLYLTSTDSLSDSAFSSPLSSSSSSLPSSSSSFFLLFFSFLPFFSISFLSSCFPFVSVSSSSLLVLLFSSRSITSASCSSSSSLLRRDLRPFRGGGELFRLI